MVSQIKNTGWLQWIDRLVGSSAGTQIPSELPRSLFYCRLEDYPDHLVPKPYFGSRRPVEDGLFINPNCSFERSPENLNSEIFRALPGSHFAISPLNGHTFVIITDPVTKAMRPFWLGPKLSGAFSSKKAGDPAPEGLSSNDIDGLASANILVPEYYETSRRLEWEFTLSISGPPFRERGYVPLRGLIHPFHIAALRRYYRYQTRNGKLHLGDQQNDLRLVAHNDPVARFFHHQMTFAVSAIAQEPVKPSYVYVAAYQEGAVLRKHVDREQCEFSVSLCLDYSPEPRLATPWPLKLESNGVEVAVFQAIGDALLYRGCIVPHWRDALPPGHRSTSIFFHYVRQDFAGPLD